MELMNTQKMEFVTNVLMLLMDARLAGIMKSMITCTAILVVMMRVEKQERRSILRTMSALMIF